MEDEIKANETPAPLKRMRWGPEQRLEFIEFLLFWEGALNRSDLTERFGVSVPQASNDVAMYRELAPTNLQYDPSGKRYIAAPGFQPRFLKPNPDKYLAQLKAISDGIIEAADTWIANSPSTGVLPVPGRRIDAGVLRELLATVRSRTAIRIHYQSTSPEHPVPLWRWITPHAFAFDSLRWHVRAFCHRNRDFRDFVLGRCIGTGEMGAPEARPDDDWLWQKTFSVVLKPNPELAEGQRRAIVLDYGMTGGQAVVQVRYALLYYFDKRLRLDAGLSYDCSQRRHVIVANTSEYEQALAQVTNNLAPESR